MRILHILDHSAPRQSAYATRTMAIMRQQRVLGWHTIHLTGPNQGTTEAYDRHVGGWHFFRTERRRNPWSRLPLLQQLGHLQLMAGRLRRVVKLTRPDLLHAHAPVLNALAALHIARRLHLPLLYEVHTSLDGPESGTRYRVARALETFVAGRADAVATASEGMRRELRRRGVAAGGITVVPDALTPRQLEPARARDPRLVRRLGLGDGPVLGFVGALHAGEGLDLLLDAFPALLRIYPGLRLLVVGAGPHGDALKAHASRLGLGGRVVFIGHVVHSRAPSYYPLIDVLVYPRLPTRLGALVPAIGALEAMAQGCLVAASDVDVHRELIGHGYNGILFDAGSIEGMGRTLRWLLSERGCWQPLREAARSYVSVERTWAASVARYAPVYTGLLERKRGR
ncbi:MAG TPA: glycosyltransferase [Telluria sp.]|nr:glycosyltransferase [Telluria sp.]